MKMTFPVKRDSFKRLDDPFENGLSKKYVFYAKVADVPDGFPMDTNPRDQKLSSGVAIDIKESLESNDGYFHLKNRGIVLSAKNVHYDNKNCNVTVDFGDNDETDVYGDIDGGHTYKIICENRENNYDQYVQFEMMTGVEEIIAQLAEARNNSVQVDVKSMAELMLKFEPLKEGLEGLPFFKRIAFKQNQLEFDDNGKKEKMIDAREIVAIVSMFNINKYGLTQPIQAYSSKAKMLEYYLEEPNFYRKFVNVIPDIFDLYDAIECEFANAFNESGGRYGRRKYAGFKDNRVIGKSKFFENDLIYKIPDGLMYPTVAAFRCLLCENSKSEKFEWKDGVDPLKVWNKCKVVLTTAIMNFANSIGDNPNRVGKDPNIWNLAYMTVLMNSGVMKE